jgi:hypothetical protein
MADLVKQNVLQAKHEGQPLRDAQRIQEGIGGEIERMLTRLARLALLVS